MSGECERCNEHTLDCKCFLLTGRMFDGVIRLGRAQERLKSILQSEVFDGLSKHDVKWDSEHQREADILEDVRLQLGAVHDNLWDLMGILQPEDQ